MADTPERFNPEEKRIFPKYPPKRVLAACTGKTEQDQTTCVSEKAGIRNPRLTGVTSGVFQGGCRLNRFFRPRVFVLAPGAPD